MAYDPSLGYDPIEAGNQSVMGAKRLIGNKNTASPQNSGIPKLDISLDNKMVSSKTPQYDFTKTPQQNAAVGNNVGMNSINKTNNQPAPQTVTPAPMTAGPAVAQPQPVIQQAVQPVTPAQPAIDVTKFMEDARKAQIDAAIANITGRYNTQVADLNRKSAQIVPQYEAKRLGEQSQSQLQAKNFAEFLANRGQSTSGYSNQAELVRNMQLGQAMNELGKQQTQEEMYYKDLVNQADVARQRDIQAAEAGANASYMDNFSKYLMQQESDRLKAQLDRERIQTERDINESRNVNERYIKGEEKKATGEKAWLEYLTKEGERTDKALQNKIENSGYNVPTVGGVPVTDITIPQDIAQKLAKDSNDYAAAAQRYGQEFIYQVQRPDLLGVQIPQAVQEQLAPYGNNFAQAAKDFAVSNPELANWAMVASTQKMASDPQLLQKHGVPVKNPDYNPDLAYYANVASKKKMFDNPQLMQQYGSQYLTQEGMKNFVDNLKKEQDIVSLKLDIVKKAKENAIFDNFKQAEYDKLISEVEKARMENRYLEPKLRADIDNITNTILNRNENTKINWGQLNVSQQNANTNTARLQWDKTKPGNSGDAFEYKADKDSFDEYTKYIDSMYTSNQNTKSGGEYDRESRTTTPEISSTRRVITQQDRKDIDEYTTGLANSGESSNVVNALRAKYGLPKIPTK